MKKIVYIDCDGTLQNDKGEISEKTKRIIEKFTEAGNHLVLCTGRPRYHVEKIWREIKCDNFFISSNGAEIYNNEEGKILKGIYLDAEDVIKIYKLAKENDMEVYAPSEGMEFVIKEVNNSNQCMFPEDINEVRKLVEKNKIKQILLKAKNHKGIEKAKQLVRETENLTILNEFNNSVEPRISIGNIKTSKGNALRELTKHLGNTIENTIAIGNDFNDLSMFEMAGKSVAMENAKDYIKEKVDFVTFSNNDDGVAVFLEQLL